MAIDVADLKSKAGPFPVWVWALIVGLVLALIMFYLRGRSQVANSGTTTAGTTATASTDPYSAFANYSAAPTSVPPTNQGASGSYETNQSWLTKAVAWLTLNGKGTALDSQSALNAYLNGGGVLDSNQTPLVNAALNQFGLPPEPVFGAPSGTNPSTTPANPAVVSYVKDPNGSISAVYSNGTKGEFTDFNQYQAFSAKHPAGPWQSISSAAYSSIPTAQTNPNF